MSTGRVEEENDISTNTTTNGNDASCKTRGKVLFRSPVTASA